MNESQNICRSQNPNKKTSEIQRECRVKISFLVIRLPRPAVQRVWVRQIKIPIRHEHGNTSHGINNYEKNQNKKRFKKFFCEFFQLHQIKYIASLQLKPCMFNFSSLNLCSLAWFLWLKKNYYGNTKIINCEIQEIDRYDIISSNGYTRTHKTT